MKHICYWVKISIRPFTLVPTKERFLECHVKDFPWPQKPVEYDGMWKAASSTGLCSQSQPGALTPGKQETSRPVMQRLALGPWKGSLLALFQSREQVPDHQLPWPQTHGAHRGFRGLWSLGLLKCRQAELSPGRQHLRGKVGMAGWASHRPGGLHLKCRSPTPIWGRGADSGAARSDTSQAARLQGRGCIGHWEVGHMTKVKTTIVSNRVSGGEVGEFVPPGAERYLKHFVRWCGQPFGLPITHHSMGHAEPPAPGVLGEFREMLHSSRWPASGAGPSVGSILDNNVDESLPKTFCRRYCVLHCNRELGTLKNQY